MDVAMLQSVPLFRGMTSAEASAALEALHAQEQEYPKGAVLLHAGSVTRQMGLVLSGSVTIESNDMWGNRTILSHVGAGQCFAETYALLPGEPMLVDVTVNESCRILFLQVQGLSGRREPWAGKLLANLLMISVQKNLHLSGRSFHTAPKTIRGRVQSYLNAVALQTGRRAFDVPFDRQQLADYLNVERTALSKELGRMQKEGLVRVRKNHFVIAGKGLSVEYALDEADRAAAVTDTRYPAEEVFNRARERARRDN